MAPVAKEAPRCLTGAGLKRGSRVEFVARSEAGGDGRLQSRRPGAEATRKAAFPQPLALGVLLPRLKREAYGHPVTARPPKPQRMLPGSCRPGPSVPSALPSTPHPDSSSPAARQNDRRGAAKTRLEAQTVSS